MVFKIDSRFYILSKIKEEFLPENLLKGKFQVTELSERSGLRIKEKLKKIYQEIDEFSALDSTLPENERQSMALFSIFEKWSSKTFNEKKR